MLLSACGLSQDDEKWTRKFRDYFGKFHLTRCVFMMFMRRDPYNCVEAHLERLATFERLSLR